MKFIQNNVAKKFIIVLIIVLLLFNAVYPNMVFAIDVGGILMQPFYWLILGFLIPLDFMFGSFFVSITDTNMSLKRNVVCC